MRAAIGADPFGDDLDGAPAREVPDAHFDRFMLNLHPTDATTPCVILGAGVYPARDVVDGFVVAGTTTEQRNLRLSTRLSSTEKGRVGPLRWEVAEPLRVWRVQLDDNPAGIGLDLVWTARTPPWTTTVAVGNDDGADTSFDHLVQSGTYAGRLRIDDDAYDVAGWWGQRDRSRGVRTMTGGQGLHLWVQAQFPTTSLGFLHVEGREGRPLLTEGAVVGEDGDIDEVVAVRHDLRFDDGLDLRTGRLEVSTASGASYPLDCDASARGGYLAGAGYGGGHGRDRGADHLEHDVYPFDGSVTPRTLDTSLTDRCTRFACGDLVGFGILEFAVSRSRRYRYRPTTS